jgi:hypothetical protein
MRNRNTRAAEVPTDPQTTPDPADREIGYLTPVNAYVLIETLRGLYVGLWGLDYNRTIHNTQTLYAMALIEGFCAGLSACVNAVELANLLGLRCCRSDGRTVESGVRPITQQLTYIMFRFVSTAFSALGVGFLGYAIPSSGESVAAIINNSTYTSDLLDALAAAVGISQSDKKFVTLGLVSLSVSAITARYLSGKKYKLSGGVLREDGSHLRAAQHDEDDDDHRDDLIPLQPVSQNGAAQMEEVVVDESHQPPLEKAQDAPVPRSVPRQQPNAFFQPSQVPQGPAKAAKGVPAKKGWKKVARKGR